MILNAKTNQGFYFRRFFPFSSVSLVVLETPGRKEERWPDDLDSFLPIQLLLLHKGEPGQELLG